MEVVLVLRELWRRRLIVLAIGLLALLAGSAVAFRLPSLESRKYEVGVATAGVLVDTPNSQVVEVAPKGSDTLGVRANLIASLMAEGDLKGSIARRAGLPPDELEGVSESSTALAAETEPAPTSAHVLTTRVAVTPGGDRLPIIEIDAQAPDAARAGKIVEAAVEGLREYLDSKAASEQIEEGQRLRVGGLGSPQARTVVRGPGNMLAVLVVIVVFGVGCAMLLAVVALIEGWRVASVIAARTEHADDEHVSEFGFEDLFADERFDDAPEEPEREWDGHPVAPRAEDANVTRD